MLIKAAKIFGPQATFDLPGSPYSLHGYYGRLDARLTFVKKAL
jgi:hypothetical protein